MTKSRKLKKLYQLFKLKQQKNLLKFYPTSVVKKFFFNYRTFDFKW